MTSEIPLSVIKKIYRKIKLIRISEEKIIEEYHKNEMKTPMHMSYGQEAITASVASIFKNNYVVGSYRSHASFLSHTEKIKTFFSELYGRIDGTCKGKSGSMHLSDIDSGFLCSSAIVSSGFPMAIGHAYSQKVMKSNNLTTIYFGDGAVEEGTFWETINFASLKSLKMLFVCEDNDYAVTTRKANRWGFKSMKSFINNFNILYLNDNSNDSIKFYKKLIAAKKHLNANKGPVFMHVKCLRYLQHCGINSDISAAYRNPNDILEVQQNDTLDKLCKYIKKNKLNFNTNKVDQEIKIEIQEAIEFAKSSPYPSKKDLLESVYYE